MSLLVSLVSTINREIHPYIRNFVRADAHSCHGYFVDFRIIDCTAPTSPCGQASRYLRIREVLAQYIRSDFGLSVFLVY